MPTNQHMELLLVLLFNYREPKHARHGNGIPYLGYRSNVYHNIYHNSGFDTTANAE